jgi:hypothetical protein
MKPFEAVKDIARSKLFSVSEDIQTCSLLKKISWKIQILWERICGITNKYPTFNRDLNSEDRKDVELLLSAISELLLATSPEESWDGYPPYWVSVMRTYMEYGFYEKALEFGDQWKSWYALAEPSSSRRDSPIWMLSLLGLCKMAMGHDIDGLNDLKTASDLQQKVWEKYPEYANDFYFDVLNAIIYLSPGIRSGQLTGCKEEFFQRLKSISKLDFQAIKDTYYS